MFYAAYYDRGYKVLEFDASKARRWAPKGKAWEHIVVNYVEHMAIEEGWLA